MQHPLMKIFLLLKMEKSELLKSEPDLKWKTKILAKCFQMKNINTEDIIRVFGILK